MTEKVKNEKESFPIIAFGNEWSSEEYDTKHGVW